MKNLIRRCQHSINRNILIAVCLGIAATVKADVVIYNLSSETTEVGQGKTQSFSQTGWSIIDVDSGEVENVRFGIRNGHKTFHVERYALDILSLQGPDSSTLTYFSLADRSLNSSNHLDIKVVTGLGVNKSLTIKTGKTIQFPENATRNERSTFATTQTDRQVVTLGEVLVFNAKATLAANSTGKTTADELLRQKQYLVAKGYIEN